MSQQYVLDLLRQGIHKGDSAVLSPVSIALALNVLNAGAAGETRRELSEFLLKGSDETALQSHLDQLQAAFENVPKDKVTLETATRLLLANEFTPHQTYLNKIHENIEVKNEDFTQAAQAAKNINSFVNDQTHGKISHIVDADTVSGAKAVIVNAVYFKANWKEQFNKQATQKKDFHLTQGGTKQVDMMAITAKFPYTEDDLAQVLQLPYKDGSFHMTFVLPKNRQGGVVQLLKELDNERLSNYLNISGKTQVIVELPKFKFETPLPLKDVLQQLGVQSAFSRRADFSALSDRPLYISDAIHKAVIEVNEEGAEAAAATAVVAKLRSAPLQRPRVVHFTADAPFLFFLSRENVVLFAGTFQ